VTQTAIPCSVMRGGTSKGLVFRAGSLPDDRVTRDAVLLAAMGSPDPREIDGMGGAHPLTSKVAVVSLSPRDNADVEYLFLQVWPDRPEVSDSQNCGNMLAAVGPFAIEQGLVAAGDPVTPVRIWMRNTQTLATAFVQTPGGRVRYDGPARIDGVPGTHAPIPIEFADVAGSSCGALLPTGNVTDVIEGTEVTCIDNGMPVVCIAAADLGLSGQETPAQLEGDAEVTRRVEAIRLAAGPLMNLGDVTSACMLPGSAANQIAVIKEETGGATDVEVEHPTGFFTVTLDVEASGDTFTVARSALLRTARLLMRGEVMVPSSVWNPA